MTWQPRISGRKLIAALKKAGFIVVRTRGSHHLVRHSDGRTTVVPVHSGETLGPELLNRILTDCEISRDELIDLL